ncbi:hypothetical protein Lal_00021003 [Lupinus albus]|nr:hypothetical protein Lal_00021003 [Lupinus albus]
MNFYVKRSVKIKRFQDFRFSPKREYVTQARDPAFLNFQTLTLSLKRGLLAQARIPQCQHTLSRPGEPHLAQARLLDKILGEILMSSPKRDFLAQARIIHRLLERFRIIFITIRNDKYAVSTTPLESYSLQELF